MISRSPSYDPYHLIQPIAHKRKDRDQENTFINVLESLPSTLNQNQIALLKKERLDLGLNDPQINFEGMLLTPLEYYCSMGDYNRVVLLVEAFEANIQPRSNASSPLEMALNYGCATGDFTISSYLEKKGAQLQYPDKPSVRKNLEHFLGNRNLNQDDKKQKLVLEIIAEMPTEELLHVTVFEGGKEYNIFTWVCKNRCSRLVHFFIDSMDSDTLLRFIQTNKEILFCSVNKPESKEPYRSVLAWIEKSGKHPDVTAWVKDDLEQEVDKHLKQPEISKKFGIFDLKRLIEKYPETVIIELLKKRPDLLDLKLEYHDVVFSFPVFAVKQELFQVLQYLFEVGKIRNPEESMEVITVLTEKFRKRKISADGWMYLITYYTDEQIVDICRKYEMWNVLESFSKKTDYQSWFSQMPKLNQELAQNRLGKMMNEVLKTGGNPKDLMTLLSKCSENEILALLRKNNFVNFTIEKALDISFNFLYFAISKKYADVLDLVLGNMPKDRITALIKESPFIVAEYVKKDQKIIPVATLLNKHGFTDLLTELSDAAKLLEKERKRAFWDMLTKSPPNEEEIANFIDSYPCVAKLQILKSGTRYNLLQWVSIKHLERVKQTVVRILIDLSNGLRAQGPQEMNSCITEEWISIYTTLFMFVFEGKIKVPQDTFAWIEEREMIDVKRRLLISIAEKLSSYEEEEKILLYLKKYPELGWSPVGSAKEELGHVLAEKGFYQAARQIARDKYGDDD